MVLLHRRSILRLAIITTLVAIVLFLTNILELRRTAYSCRTVWSCIGLASHHAYTSHTAPAKAQWHTSETTLRDGSIRFDRIMTDTSPDLVFMILSRDDSSWSSDFRSSQRSIYDLVELVASTKLNLTQTSLAIMTSSVSEYPIIKQAMERLPLARTSILLQPERSADDTDTASAASYHNRHSHDAAVQFLRRSKIATLRNYLMLRTLADEAHVIWLDADVVYLSPDIVQTMTRHSRTNADAGIITAACHQNQMENYDKNAWKVVPSPRIIDAVLENEHTEAVNDLVQTRIMVPELIAAAGDKDIVELDSVGGTILYIRADLVRQGLTFPSLNMVGTTWNGKGKGGWIGVETEGLCYAASGLIGGRCYILGGTHHVRHTDWG